MTSLARSDASPLTAASASQGSARPQSPAFWILLATVLWAPWPLGSNRAWALASLAMMVWGGVVVSASMAVTNAAGPPLLGRKSRFAWVPVGGLVGFALLLMAQIVPGWGADGGPISIDVFSTRVYLLTTLAYLGAWLLVLLTVDSRERAARLLGAIVLAGVLQAVAAVLLYSSAGHYSFLFTSFEQGGRATGTFPNPDHLAGYMELCLSAGLGWLLSQFGRGEGATGRGWRANAVGLLTFVMSGKMLLRLLLMVMVIALVMTHSRMGNGAFFIALLIAGGVVASVSKQLRRPALWLVASMALVDVVIIGQWVGLDHVVERMQNTDLRDSTSPGGFGLAQAPAQREETLEQRLVVPRLSLRLVADRPWFGHGGGSYATAFPPFKPAGDPVNPYYWDHAHDDYIQVACDTGVVGLVLWLMAGVATLVRAVWMLGDSKARAHRGFAVAALMALCTMGLHSLVDFNLHIPANAITFAVILAVVWALPTGSRRRGPAAVSSRLAGEDVPVGRTSADRKPWRAWATLLAALPVLVYAGWQGERLMHADWASAAARNQVMEWVGGASIPGSVRAWNEACQAIERSLDVTPDDPDLHERLGDLHTVAGQRDWNSPTLRRDDFQRAAASYRRATELRPSEAGAWAMLAAASQAAGESISQTQAAWSRALRFGPYEPAVQLALLQVVLADWAGATPEMQAWAEALFDHGSPSTRHDINALAKSYGLVFTADDASVNR